MSRGTVTMEEQEFGSIFGVCCSCRCLMSSPSRLLLRVTDRRTRAICNAADLAEHTRAAILAGTVESVVIFSSC